MISIAEAELLADEADRCLAGLIKSDLSFADYFREFCRKRCDGWLLDQIDDLAFGVNRLAEMSTQEILDRAKTRPLSEAELDRVEAYCDRQDGAGHFVVELAKRRELAASFGVQPGIVHHLRDKLAN